MDSSRSSQRAVIQFLLAKGERASQIYRRMKEAYGEQCLARCTIFRWCQLYEAGRVNIKDLSRPVQAHVATNNAKIVKVPESFYLLCRINQHGMRIGFSEMKSGMSVDHRLMLSLLKEISQFITSLNQIRHSTRYVTQIRHINCDAAFQQP
ncbi:hypothetical protein AVEN_207046-1 [Araneus ventricosus]|uniref:Mos1 transposase HTH domain-containing protein n=1 Tax=Araneus ventricosus TaxID=182803 RepID=A0A4Y2K132_ARAVE|nr:hypothetical protein AVEN_207046-1 [Araneus ventricosus]